MDIAEVRYDWLYSPGVRRVTEFILLHHAGVPRISSGYMHKRHMSMGGAGIAYHYLVGKDGVVYRGRPEDWRSGEGLGISGRTLSVCFEGNFNREQMTELQAAAGVELVTDLRLRYGGVMVRPHKGAAVTSCPGIYFPYGRFLE